MIYKRCSRCGKRLPEGKTCICIKQRHKEYDRYSRDKKSDSFYHSKEWKEARDKALEADEGLDVYAYMTSGQIIAADTVHHIVPLRDDWSKRCDVSNLMSLSPASHNTIEWLYKQGRAKAEKTLTDMLKRYRESR